MKYYLNNSNNYLNIILESDVALLTKHLAKSYKIDLKLKGPPEPNPFILFFLYIKGTQIVSKDVIKSRTKE